MALRELLIIGGAEDKTKECGILSFFIERVNQRRGKIVVITTATRDVEEVGKEYLHVFKELGGEQLRVLNINSRQDAHQGYNIEELESADGIFFTGGDQLRITSILGGTPVAKAIYRAFERDAIIAGTSAGAAIMSETMIVEGRDTESPRRCTVKMAPGLGFLKQVVVDMHFSQRGRQGRLLTAIGQNPEIIGVGIDEDTAIWIRDNKLKVLGNQTVWVVDGRGISCSNVSELSPDEVLVLTNVTLHILPKDYGYDLSGRRVLSKEYFSGFCQDKGDEE